VKNKEETIKRGREADKERILKLGKFEENDIGSRLHV
jgi:hypothetical protein